jgi:hypothetical protein
MNWNQALLFASSRRTARDLSVSPDGRGGPAEAKNRMSDLAHRTLNSPQNSEGNLIVVT